MALQGLEAFSSSNRFDKFHQNSGAHTIEVHIGEVISRRQKGLSLDREDFKWTPSSRQPSRPSHWSGPLPECKAGLTCQNLSVLGKGRPQTRKCQNSFSTTPILHFEEESSFTRGLVHPSSHLRSAFCCQSGCRTVCESAHIPSHPNAPKHKRQTPSLGGSPTRWEQAWPQIITKKRAQIQLESLPHTTSGVDPLIPFNWRCCQLRNYLSCTVVIGKMPPFGCIYSIWIYLGGEPLIAGMGIWLLFAEATFHFKHFQAIMKEWNVGSKQFQKSGSLAATQIPSEHGRAYQSYPNAGVVTFYGTPWGVVESMPI